MKENTNNTNNITNNEAAGAAAGTAGTAGTVGTAGSPGKLWDRNFTTINVATVFGAIGGVASGYAMQFLVYNETGSTLLAAILMAVRILPGFLIPMFVAPLMDRLPRKPFLVGGDAAAAVIYGLAGIWLKFSEFDYGAYLAFTLLLSCVWSLDELAYNSLFPKLIPKGLEEKGYAASSMLYPLVNVVVMPLAAVLYKTVGVANILLGQAVLSLLATFTESTIRIKEEVKPGSRFSFKQWREDVRDAAVYLKNEKGILALTLYTGTGSGMFMGCENILVAFFSASPVLYSWFAVAEVAGRSIGGILAYKRQIKREKKYKFALGVYLTYDSMDAVLLWLPYPFMLVNRAICGFLGAQSSTMRYAATQKYIPESMRARINGFQSMVFLAFESVLTLAVGALGDIMDLRVVMTVCGAICLAVCFLTVVRRRGQVEKIYMTEERNED
ncbi:MAG: MFS transporter [Clostridia bacterium]|nr:MFS transporter [Clostridia bacterium]